MKKLTLIMFLLFIAANSLTAQYFDFSGALSRMESAIDDSQEEFTLRDSYYLGRAVAANIVERYTLYTEKPELTDYLNLICGALAVNSPAPDWFNGYYVMILDDPAFNAYSTPGGHIFISRGLVELASSEDMLAAIIAHELAHIQLMHGIAEIIHNRMIMQLTQERGRISNNLAVEIQRQLFTESVNEIVLTLFSRGYSQLQEFEADSTALFLLVSAGYNPGSLIELLNIFERLEGNQPANLIDSHPLPSQRIANLQSQIPPLYRFADNSAARMKRFNRIMERR